MVEYAVVNILLDYLSRPPVNQYPAKATAIINFQDGLSTVSAVIVAHIADSCIGRFKINFICTIAYIVVSPCLLLFNISYGFEKKKKKIIY